MSSETQPQTAAPPSPSPSPYLDLPPAPHADNAKDDLSYISHMLMEEDIVVDNLYHRYRNHPMLLSAEQPFAQILCANATSDAIATDISVQPYPLQSSVPTPEYYSYSDMVTSNSMHVHQDASSLLVNGSTHEAESSGMDMISMAFYKGMEDATKLLITSKTHSDTLDRDRGRKKRLQEAKDGVGVAMGRSSKQKAVQWQPGSEEEAAACEMLDQLMLSDEPSHAGKQRELISSMKLEKPQERRRGGAAGLSHTVDLHALLIQCAEAMATNDQQGAANLLLRIRHHSSPTGDATRRLAHCFTQGLEARLMGTGSHMYKLLLAKCRAATSTLKVYQMYMAASSVFPVSFLLSNRIAYNAIAGRQKLHIVHYGLGHGFHLPDLLRMLSSREGGPPEVRITGIDNPLPGFHPGHIIEETGRRLSDCARQFRVPFKFRAIAAKLEAVCAEDLDIDPDEVLVVISHFCFKNLMDESVTVDRPNPRDTVLKNIANMRPEVFIHDILNGSYSGAFFVSRFREALKYFAAMFDAMDTIMPQENQNRLLAEQWLAMCVMNIVACEGVDRVSRPHSYKQWQVRSKRAGLRQLPLDPNIVQMFKDKVKEEYHKYIVINEDHEWLLTGWKGRVLSAFSTWTADDVRSGLSE